MASKKKGVVGIVGLGIMGGAFAENLLAAGWRVVGYDVSAARRRALARAGVEIATDAADIARKAPVIITSLPKSSALAATVAAIVEAGVPRRVVIEASTFKLEDKAAAEAALRKAGHLLLDCPVSGTGLQAKVKDLVIYASGGSAEIKRAAPAVRRLQPRGARSRRIRQWQPNEIHRQSPRRHPQRCERRGDGAGHESRAAAAAHL